MNGDPTTDVSLSTAEMFLFGLLLVGWLVSTVVVLRRVVRRETLIPFSARTPVPWTIWHVLSGFFLFMLALVTALAGFGELFQIDADKAVDFLDINALKALICATIVAGAFGLTTFQAIARPTWPDLGLSGADSEGDVALGVIAFAAIGPWIYGLNWLLSLYIPEQHPMIESIQNDSDPQLFLFAAANAVLLAPIVEEFMFRVVLQGWLERVIPPWLASFNSQSDTDVIETSDVIKATVVATESETSDSPALRDDPIAPAAHSTSAEVDTNDAEAASQYNPFTTPVVDHPTVTRIDVESPQPALRSWAAWLPILVSSALFSVVHIGQGPAPIPIFFLALVLGYVYQRTHRVLPCIVAHMSLNAFSMAILWAGS